MDSNHITSYQPMLIRLLGCIILNCVLPTVNADVTFDGSLGPGGTLTGPVMEITADHGQLAGNNLFHSFTEFNVNTGQTANFSGPDNVQNIFGRVTGGNPSTIDGTISSSIQGANLFLMNPNGMLFGPNMQINISGSFHATTADYVSFGNQERFYADINQDTTLSVAAPSAFGFLDNSTGDIAISGSNLSVQDGNNISLVGGNITLTDGSSVSAPNGNVNIASAQSAGEINTIVDQTDLSQFERLGTITLENSSSINANGYEGGKVVIRGGELVLVSSTVSANSNSGSPGEDSLNIDIELSNELLLTNYSQITSNTPPFSENNAGDINITTSLVELDDHSNIASISDSNSEANSGDILVTADEIELSNYSSIKSNSSGSGSSGDISITTTNLEIKNASQISSASNSPGVGGNAGNIHINADSVSLTGLSSASDSIDTNFTGIDASGASLNSASGNIDIQSSNIAITNRARIQNDVFGNLDGGDITIESDTLNISSGGRITTTNYGSGQGGSIGINSDKVMISGINIDPVTGVYSKSGITANTNASSGNAGNITINSKDFVLLDGASVISNTYNSGGNAGNIVISSEDIFIYGVNAALYKGDLEYTDSTDFSLLDARSTISSEGLYAPLENSDSRGGDAGNISLIGENISISSGAWISSNAVNDSLNATNSGDILINANQLTLKNGGSISSAIEGTGHAGNIHITSDSIYVTGSESDIFSTGILSSTDESSRGIGGNINIEADLLSIVNGAKVDAKTRGTGYGGNINIESELIEIRNGGLITAGSEGTGAAGDINITKANRIYVAHDGAISTTTSQADGGNITVNSQSLIYQVNGTINTSVNDSVGDGGNINISTNLYVLNSGQVIANAHEGRGGNISISANRFIIDSESIVDASSQLGFDGQVNIDVNGNNIKNPEKLPDTKDDVANKFTTLCSSYSSELSRLSISDFSPADSNTGRFLSSDYGSSMTNLNTKILNYGSNDSRFANSENSDIYIKNSFARVSCY